MIENIQTKKAFDPDSRYDAGLVEDTEPQTHRLDTPEMLQVHRKLMEWYHQERERQAVNRYQMAIDEDFYDGLQWSDDDAQALIERGQAPLVFNKVKPTVDWVLGTEKKTRVDWNVFPRNDQDVEAASVKTSLLKYVSDINKAGFARSRAFADAVKVGLGWLEDGVRGDSTEDPLYSRSESWRNMIYDGAGVERDGSDSRYLYRHKWLDLDVAIAMFPERENEIRQAAVSADLFGNDMDEEFYLGQALALQDRNMVLGRRTFVSDATLVNNRRERVKLIECWYRVPQRDQVMHGDVFNGQVFDHTNTLMQQAVEQGVVSLYERISMKVMCAVMTEGHLLEHMPSPYKHNRFPFTPIWGFRRGRDNAPYGIIRNIRDAQEDLNKRASKALFILSTNRIIAEEGAVDDWDELRDEAARPDGIIVKKASKLLEIENDRGLAEEHVMMMDRDAAIIQDVGGVTDENLGRDTNATSGRAIVARQTQGSTVTAEYFDNLRYAIQLQGEIQLSLVEQYYTEPKVIRLVGAKGKLDWLKINQPKYNPATGRYEYLNDITASEADFVVDETDFSESVRQALFQSMMDMISRMPPQMAIQFLDVVFEFSDLPGKDELVKRIRKINGQADPDAKPDPEAEAARAAQEQMAAAAADRAARMEEAKISKAEADAGLVKAQTIETLVDAEYESMQGAQVVATVPGVTPVADAILQGAGWQNNQGDMPNIPSAGPVPDAAGPVPPNPAMMGVRPNTHPEFPARPGPSSGLMGAKTGIETPARDGILHGGSNGQ